ncbi:sugar ABC transporter permease [Candidatus Aerophobetes bacterium]|nr:sugar ABC transporter permease [Candidatus Aerophobetes bacterium]
MKVYPLRNRVIRIKNYSDGSTGMKKTFTRIFNFVDSKFCYISTLPALIVIVLVVGFPTVLNFYMSFFVKNLMRQATYFNGVGNYVSLVQDPVFWSYLAHTGIYTGGSVAIGFTLALCLALALNSEIRFRPFFIVAILLPWMTPAVSGCIMWRWIIHDIYGLLNFFLIKLGILHQNFFWLGNSFTATLLLILVDAWYRIPLSALILFAGMQRIPLELYDAAKVDGAGRWYFTKNITIPLIKPEILIALVIQSMFTFREFGIPFLFTGGGPGDSTETLALYIYKVGNLFLREGYAASLSVVMFIIITIFVVGYFKAIGEKS